MVSLYWEIVIGVKGDRKMIDNILDDVRFYFNVGILEDGPIMHETLKGVMKTLMGLGKSVIFEEFKGSHDYLSWGDYLGRGLIALSKKA